MPSVASPSCCRSRCWRAGWVAVTSSRRPPSSATCRTTPATTGAGPETWKDRAEFKCVASTSGSCHVVVFASDCPDAGCTTRMLRELTLPVGTSRTLTGLPRGFKHCVAHDAKPVAPDLPESLRTPPMIASLFFLLRLAAVWLLTLILFAFLTEDLFGTGGEWLLLTLCAAVLALVVASAFSHLRRVRLIAGQRRRERAVQPPAPADRDPVRSRRGLRPARRRDPRTAAHRARSRARATACRCAPRSQPHRSLRRAARSAAGIRWLWFGIRATRSWPRSRPATAAAA